MTAGNKIGLLDYLIFFFFLYLGFIDEFIYLRIWILLVLLVL